LDGFLQRGKCDKINEVDQSYKIDQHIFVAKSKTNLLLINIDVYYLQYLLFNLYN